MKKLRENLPIAMFLFSFAVVVWGYGVVSHRNDLLPYPLVRYLFSEAEKLFDPKMGATPTERPIWYRERPGASERFILHDASAMEPGLTLITGIKADNEILAEVVRADGDVVHSWTVDWFEMWPNPTHLPEDAVPKSKPGSVLHGVLLLGDGDLVFNFEDLGMIRIDACGAVKWRLAHRTHHSLHWDQASRSFWTSGLIVNPGPDPRFPKYEKNFHDYTVMQISPEGQVLTQFSIVDLLFDNGLQGLLYMPTDLGNSPGDTLHVNDVEIFPETLKPGIFNPGDIMISFRNINSVIVFDRTTYKTKFLFVGKVLRQHDPDYVDGNTISVFDNNDHMQPMDGDVYSRIVQTDARTGSLQVVFSGSEDVPFFTQKMGKHQLLENGNILITESTGGRSLEVTPDGRLVWEYVNVVEPGIVGWVDEVQRLPTKFDADFFAKRMAACGGRI